jgi:hypothetical protein
MFPLCCRRLELLVTSPLQTHAVGLITKAWDDTSMNVHHVTEEILECLCVDRLWKNLLVLTLCDSQLPP